MNKRRWIQTGLVSIALIAAAFGVAGVTHTHPSNQTWVAALENTVAANNTASSYNTVQAGNQTTANVPSSGSQTSQNRASQVLTQTSNTQVSSASHPTDSGTTNHSGQSGSTFGKSSSSSSPAIPPAAPNLGTFTIVVSEDHGQSPQRKTVSIVKGESLMDYMHQYYDVTTAYGDNFVISINGIKSQWTNVPPAQRQPVDWFLYVNGTEAPVGPADIVPRAGDIDMWDYHRWDPSTGKGS